MFPLLIKQFLRNRIAAASLLLLFAAGIISISIGNKFLQHQQAAIAETAQHQKQHIERLLKYENKEFGLLMYYLKFAYINPTDNLAGLAIGQRDINSSMQANTIMGLEGQKYDADIRNPFQLMMGNLDLSFVILYLFPLVIITLCYNLYSEEKENGTWYLLKTQSKSTTKYLLQKMAVPYLFVLLVLFLLYTVATVWLQIPFNNAFTGFIVSNSLYVSCWFAISLLVVSFYKSSAVNAIALLSIWLLLTLLLPAAINNYITQKYIVPESLSTMLKQRDGYHKKWDITKDSTLKLFFKQYPQYKNYQWKAEGFDWLWYYAMQHMGDADAKADAFLFMQKLRQREAVSKQFSYWLPSLYTQQYNAQLAQTNLKNHLQFLDSSAAYHETLRLSFYPKIFTAAPVLKEDWTKQVPQYCSIKNEAGFLQSLYIGLFVLIIGAAAIWQLKKALNKKMKKHTLIFILFFCALKLPAQHSIKKTDSFYSPSVQVQLKYTIILPANYFKEKNNYPVVYLLHGHTGNYTSWISYAQLPPQLATQYNCIIILPDAGNSWYVNWTGQTDGKPHQWEDMLVKDLIPVVDKKYRTVSNKNNRAIGGLSMGGYGALAVGLKNTNLFGFIFSSAGAINFCQNIKNEMATDTLDWNSPQLWSNGDKIIDVKHFSTQTERTPKGSVFKTTADADIYDPYILLNNADTASLPFIHIDCGNKDDFIKDAYQFIEKLNIKTKQYSFITFTGEHEVPYWRQAIEHTFKIMNQQKIFK